MTVAVIGIPIHFDRTTRTLTVQVHHFVVRRLTVTRRVIDIQVVLVHAQLTIYGEIKIIWHAHYPTVTLITAALIGDSDRRNSARLSEHVIIDGRCNTAVSLIVVVNKLKLISLANKRINAPITAVHAIAHRAAYRAPFDRTKSVFKVKVAHRGLRCACAAFLQHTVRFLHRRYDVLIGIAVLLRFTSTRGTKSH